MHNLKVTVNKADGTARGDGWYFLVSGEKDGAQLQDIGGDSWYSSEKSARAAGKDFAQNCTLGKYGWTVK